ncbi:sugar phosphate isomerase/epimerase [Frankia sp. CiP3]|uniref:sugar phosphate isomerase/epimerase family protein n=1 Tax=Frankia sp. CiP3 TaxID=2880971 RepID=UPI001EF70B55|nr:TIM barrel protein [Frankia sp. CiP3]
MIPSLSLQSLGYPDDDPPTVTRMAIAAGFTGVHLHLHLTPPTDRDRLARLVDHHQLTVTWVYPINDLFSADAATRHAALATFTATAAYSARLRVAVVSSRLPADIIPIATRRHALPGALANLVDLAGTAGLTCGIEHLHRPTTTWHTPQEPAGSLTDLVELLSALGPATGLVVNSAHLAAAGALGDLASTTATESRTWLERVIDVRLADPPPAGQPEHEQRWPGTTGRIDHTRLCNQLADAGYRGPVMVEASAAPGVARIHAAFQARTFLSTLPTTNFDHPEHGPLHPPRPATTPVRSSAP